MNIPYCSITGPCGHTTDFELTCIARDQFCCCQCGREWHIIQAPPIVHASGWIQPGDRTEIEGPAPVTRKRGRRAA